MKLTKFIVQGWALDPETKERVPLRKSTVEAINEEQAAKTYARCQNLKPEWTKGTKEKLPLVIIRTNIAPKVEERKQRRAA